MYKETILQVEKLSKYHKGNDYPAIDNVSLAIKRNEIFGLLGPNGAGKTTLISVMCGLYKPDSGHVLVNGTLLHQHLKSLKKIIGIVPQDIALYPTLTARENLLFFGHVYGLPRRFLDDKIDQCLTILELEKSKNKKINTFSGGMKRRINIAAGLLHEPQLLFLDEPTVGIDVHSKKVIIDYRKTSTKMALPSCTHHTLLMKPKIFAVISPSWTREKLLQAGNPLI
ncbi:MAG TPA: ABC transporter ATP-binding protein [Bacteroidales bacterium]|nr:ABC transporter ATP-binding protein [Bacteroidales bacterium]